MKEFNDIINISIIIHNLMLGSRFQSPSPGSHPPIHSSRPPARVITTTSSSHIQHIRYVHTYAYTHPLHTHIHIFFSQMLP